MNKTEDRALKIFESMGKWLLIIFIMMALFTCVEKIAKGDPLYGQDYLGIQSKNFKSQSIPSYLGAHAPFGSLHHTFGDDVDNITVLLHNIQPTYYRVHLINSTCIRNRNCGPYEIGYGFTKESFDKAVRARNTKILKFVRDGAALYQRMAQSFPGTTFIVSPALEHDLSKEAWRILADNVAAVWPQVILDNSPDGGVAVERYKGAWIERHGTSNIAGADIISTDGVDITDSDIVKLKKDGNRAKIIFAWTRSYNLRTQAPGWVDPRARLAAPSNETLEMVGHIFDDRGAVPRLEASQCKKIIKFARPWIWKPLSEDGGAPDPRANLPVSLTQFNKNELQLLSSKGQAVGKLALYPGQAQIGNYALWRHYSGYKSGSGLSGYEFEKRARALSGSPYIAVQSGNQCAYPVIGGQRNGSYR